MLEQIKYVVQLEVLTRAHADRYPGMVGCVRIRKVSAPSLLPLFESIIKEANGSSSDVLCHITTMGARPIIIQTVDVSDELSARVPVIVIVLVQYDIDRLSGAVSSSDDECM